MIDHNKCPACAEQETGQYLHKCKNHQVKQHRIQILSQLPKKMRKLQTSPSIISVLMEQLKEIWSKTPTYNSKRHLPGLQAAITSQQQI